MASTTNPASFSSASTPWRVNLVLISVSRSSPRRRHLEVEIGDGHHLVVERAQPHLDALVLLVPQGHVLEAARDRSRRVQLAVEHVEHVAVELGGDPGGVVVGGDQAGPVLDQVGAEQEAGRRGP